MLTQEQEDSPPRHPSTAEQQRRSRNVCRSCVSLGRKHPNRLLALLASMLLCTAFVVLFMLTRGASAPPFHYTQDSTAIYFGHALLPHPEKVYRGGEDAYFVNTASQAFGVADGVGSWSQKPDMINPARFSRSLMQFTERAIIREENDNQLTPVQALRASFDRVKYHELLGSCTAVVGRLQGRVLHVANLGDSGLIILRPTDDAVRERDASPYEAMHAKKQDVLQEPGNDENPYGLGDAACNDPKATPFRVVFRSKEQQHASNVPFQLATSSQSAVPEHADVSSHELVEGDIVIVGSDGLFDNLFDSDIIKLASMSPDPQELSYIIATQAQQRAKLTTGERATPFAVNCLQAGTPRPGGKLDDITVIVGIFA